MTTMAPHELVAAAARARRAAYVPSSGYPVGAAVVCEDGRVFTGCNVECASRGLTLCAERVAIFTAVAHGQRRILAAAVVSGPGARMCGACRQVLAEFADEDVLVYLADTDGAFRVRPLRQLLPMGARRSRT